MGGRNLACRGLAFFSTGCAVWILGRAEEQDITIAAASQGLLPLMTDQALPFEEALDWLQFAYTADQTGAYVAS